MDKIIILILLFLSPATFAQEPILDKNFNPNSNNTKSNSQMVIPNSFNPILSGRIAEEQYLPSSFYGTWQVVSSLVSTDSPKVFRDMAVDTWTLDQHGDKIRLANPDTGAQSYITVNQVHNNTATFTCAANIEKGYLKIERVTITVNGKNFNRYNIFQNRYFKKKKLVKVEQALFSLSAKKLSGPTPESFNK